MDKVKIVKTRNFYPHLSVKYMKRPRIIKEYTQTMIHMVLIHKSKKDSHGRLEVNLPSR